MYPYHLLIVQAMYFTSKGQSVSFWKPVLKPGFHVMGLGNFVNINIFVMKYYFIQFIFSFLSNLLNQNMHKC